MLNIIFVYKSGGIYSPKDVELLANNLRGRISLPHNTICLTDEPEKVAKFVDKVVPLTEKWPGWWSKIELFKPDSFFGQCLFFDLDTRFLSNIDDIARYTGDFCMLRDFNRPRNMASGMMAWRASENLDYIFEGFRLNYLYLMEYHKRGTGKGFGDQGYLQATLTKQPEFFQDLFPARCISYKKHYINADYNRQLASVLCFHGTPKPLAVNL